MYCTLVCFRGFRDSGGRILTQNWACTNLYFIRSFSGQRGRNYDGKSLLGLHALQGCTRCKAETKLLLETGTMVVSTIIVI